MEAPVSESRGVAQRHGARERACAVALRALAVGGAGRGDGALGVTVALVEHTKGPLPGRDLALQRLPWCLPELGLCLL